MAARETSPGSRAAAEVRTPVGVQIFPLSRAICVISTTSRRHLRPPPDTPPAACDSPTTHESALGCRTESNPPARPARHAASHARAGRGTRVSPSNRSTNTLSIQRPQPSTLTRTPAASRRPVKDSAVYCTRHWPWNSRDQGRNRGPGCLRRPAPKLCGDGTSGSPRRVSAYAVLEMTGTKTVNTVLPSAIRAALPTIGR
jgi:hypothetical protein